jgi:endonuclease I
MKNARVGLAVLAAIVVLMSVMGLPLPPELAERLAELGIPVPKSSLLENELSDPATLGNLPKTAAGFSTPKRSLYEAVYGERRKTFYCGCEFNEDKAVDLQGCGVRPRRNEERALRAEAEHVFPASQFGYSRRCWREPEAVCGEHLSGRDCCRRTDPVFEAAHNDLHNLFPAVGEVNGDRANYRWGMVPGGKRAYGVCNIEVDPEHVQERWWRREGHRLASEDLETVLAEKPEVLVVGTGYDGRMQVPEETIDSLRAEGVDVRTAKTGETVKEFNRLQREYARIVAALHLTC